MNDEKKPRRQLIAELAGLRQRVAELEAGSGGGEAQEGRKLEDGPCQAGNLTGQSEVEQERDRLRTILTAAVECLPFSFWALDSQGRYVLANAVARTLWGEIIGQRPADVAGDEQRLSAWLENHRRARAGEKVENEAEFTVSGDARSFHNVLAPIRMGEQIIGILGFNEDITERKRMETALRQSEELFQAFMDNAPGVAWIKDEQGHFVYINKRSRQFLGVPREEWIGKTDFDLWPKELAEQYKKHDLEVLTSGQTMEFVEEAATEGGNSYWWSFKFPFRYATGKMGVGGIAVDITERRRAEESLQKAHDELEAKVQQRTSELAIFHRFAEASSQGFGMADLDGRIAYVNPAMCRLLGEANPGDAIGRPMWSYYLEGVKERRANEILPALERAGFWEGELPMLSGPGTLAPPLHHVFLLRDTEGKPVRRCVIVTDLSERKQAEAALQRERQSLWRMLQASDHERRTISYEIHDGLAQYLAAAGMQFQRYDALRENSPDQAHKAHETAVELVRQSYLEARRLINQVRPPIIDEIGLASAISHLVREQQEQGGPQIHFESNVPFGRLASVLENALYRIAQEALTNACKHSQSKKVTVSLSHENQEVCLNVQDWGIGFDPQSVGKGHFGVESIRQRVRLLGGRLTIDSKPGHGTLVHVVVPILEKRSEK